MPIPHTPKTELRRQIADFYRDLDLLKGGWTPDERALRDAPLIENWCLDVHSEGDAAPGILVLQGNVSGHPRFPGVVQIRTSKLFALNRKEGWARTASRFYRLGSSPYDQTVGLTPDPSSHAVREQKDYVALFQSLPQPTLDQKWAFARHVSTAHSWYKHLPPFPPGAPFYFYVDPAAGMQHAVAPDGSVQVLVREKPGFHYSWLPTSEYRQKFGCLAYAQSRGTSVSMVLPNGLRLIPSDDQPTFYRADRARICAESHSCFGNVICQQNRELGQGTSPTWNIAAAGCQQGCLVTEVA
jgi:hypothetical protein